MLRFFFCVFAAAMPALNVATRLISTKNKHNSILLGSKRAAQQPLVTQTAAFNTAEEACCGCFGAKYDWPNKDAIETCDTCYAFDVYGVAAKDAELATKQGHNAEGVSGDAYETIDQSRVMGVHEWNWNCQSGKAPEDASQWTGGPVEGEPAARAAFLMCKESSGWHCPKMQQRLAAGSTEPEEDETKAPSDKPTVETMSLPSLK